MVDAHSPNTDTINEAFSSGRFCQRSETRITSASAPLDLVYSKQHARLTHSIPFNSVELKTTVCNRFGQRATPVLRSDWSSSLNSRFHWPVDSSKDKVSRFPASIIALIDWFAYHPWLLFFDNHTKSASKRV